MTKTKNPLYVVTNNGEDVEKVDSILELLLKKSGLDKFIPLFETILKMLLSQVESYPVFMEVKKVFDKLFEKFIVLLFELQNLAPKKG